ncbi:MAG TPA: lysozyme inhibitor LprI family protein [Candidatus Baltobacteraceae bacterium]
MKALALVALIAVLPSAPGAATSKASPLQACLNTAMTDPAINACAAANLERAEHSLNISYRNLLSQAAREPGAAAKVRIAERAWLNYRDAYVIALYPNPDKTEYGTIWLSNALYARALLARQQATSLNVLLSRYNHTMNCRTC